MDRRVRRIIDMLDLESHRCLHVGELAKRVGLGPSRLEHLFKTNARISIRDFIRERRLAAAAALLETTEERISVIGYQVGYRDASNFNHAFKRRFGVSPRTYRARLQDDETAEDTK